MKITKVDDRLYRLANALINRTNHQHRLAYRSLYIVIFGEKWKAEFQARKGESQ